MSDRAVQLALEFTNAWSRRDLEAARALVADDVAFTGPITSLRGADAYIEALGQWAQLVQGVEVVAALGDGDQAILMYTMRTGPFGPLPAAERFQVVDGRIAEDHVIWDTHLVRPHLSQ